MNENNNGSTVIDLMMLDKCLMKVIIALDHDLLPIM